jgi:hypothetical protein
MELLGNRFHNLDKHREFQPLVVNVDLSAAVVRVIDGLTTGSGDLHAAIEPRGRPVAVYARGRVNITFEDGRAIVPTLRRLEVKVSALIDAFVLAFDERDRP